MRRGGRVALKKGGRVVVVPMWVGRLALKRGGHVVFKTVGGVFCGNGISYTVSTRDGIRTTLSYKSTQNVSEHKPLPKQSERETSVT